MEWVSLLNGSEIVVFCSVSLIHIVCLECALPNKCRGGNYENKVLGYIIL